MTNQGSQTAIRGMLADMRQLRQALEQLKHAPIAVVGMGCRFPHSADSPDQFWRLLADGIDAVAPVPANRWNVSETFDSDRTATGKSYTRNGAFLDDVDQFEPHFFNISPREANGIDPQQRLLLEVAWEALEHAAILPASLKGSNTGVFIGQATDDYAQRSIAAADTNRIDAYNSLGAHRSVTAGRIAYWLGLHGTTFQLDTACSSSLLAIHLAVQSLRSGEIDCALAGGVNMMLSPNLMVSLSKLNALSPDGRCKSFDASANGYGRGEGCGIVVLKRLVDAQAAGDNILAVIRGSATNHDGQSNGLTAPSGQAQEALIRKALKNARLQPKDVQYVEAHGTGTPLGDPIEIHSIGRIYGQNRNDTIKVGSVKSNIGHLEGAGGIAGFIKTVLALQHRQIPPNLHFEKPNPLISWHKYPVQISDELHDWQAGEAGRNAGVSAFGVSGTNVHLIVGESPVAAAPTSDPTRQHHILPLAARTPASLQKLATAYADFLSDSADISLTDLCATAAHHRTHFTERRAFVAADISGMIAQLRDLSTIKRDTPQIAFLFTGQGGQYVEMAREMYETTPLFRATVDECDAILQAQEGIAENFLTRITQTYLDQTEYLQPTLFTLQVALGKLWQALGVQPDFMLGHSAGEYAAAHLAGVFSLADGLKLVSARGRLVQALPQDGKMAIVFASEMQLRRYVAPHAADVSIAAINTYDNTVIAGKRVAVDAILDALTQDEIAFRLLKVSHAFHCPLVEPMVDDFRAVIETIAFSTPRIPIISTLLGRQAFDEFTDHDYWVDHILQPVRFADAMTQVADCNTFIEIGPKSTLLTMGETSLPDGKTWLPSLSNKQPDHQTFLSALGHLYECGLSPNWEPFYAAASYRRLHLPTYRFDRQRYWLEPPTVTRFVKSTLLGQPLDLAGSAERRYLDQWNAETVGDYRLFDTPIAPAALTIAAALTPFANQLPIALTELALTSNVLLDETREMQLAFVPQQDGSERFELYQRRDEVWEGVASAEIHPLDSQTPNTTGEIDFLKATITDPIADFYAESELGASFRVVKQAWRSDDELFAKLDLAAGATYPVPVALLDACCQLAIHATDRPHLPIGLAQLHLFALPQNEVWAHVQIVTGETLTADVRLLAADGTLIATLTGLALQPIERATLLRSAAVPSADWFYTVNWREAEQQPVISADFCPTPTALTTPLIPDVTEREQRDYATALPTLNQLAQTYALHALSQLGWTWRVGERVTADEIADQWGVKTRYHRRLLERVLVISAESNNWITHVDDHWHIQSRLPAANLPKNEAAVTAHPCIDAEQKLLIRCGRELAGVLTGRVDPIQLLFPRGNLSDASKLYRDSTAARLMNHLMRDAVRELVAKLPQDRPIRILEIGAGTGSTTLSLLPHLPPDRTDYLFTDLADLLTEQARQEFIDFPFVNYGLLNIEHPYVDGVVQSQQFDIVIAANIVHATRNLRQTLGNVRDLLAPNGLLLMLEGTQRQAWVDLIFGLTEGWWRFDDVDLRADHPLLSADQWQTFLPEIGFASADCVADDLFHQALIVAQAPPTVPAGEWVIISQSDDVSLVEPLEKAGHRCFVRDVAVVSAEFLQNRTDLRGIVCLLDGSLENLLTISQAIIASNVTPPNLWITTQGVSDGNDYTAQGAFWGFGRVLRREHPELNVRLFDGDPAQLIAALSAADDELALHDGQLVTPRLERVPLPPAAPAPVHADGSYLVTGGLGGLGLLTAQWLVEQRAGEVVLIGRSKPTSNQQKQIAALATADTTITVRQVDVTRVEQVSALIDDLAPTLRGVIHSAGSYVAELVFNHQWERFERGLAAKLTGAILLDELTTDLPLDFFVLYSTVSSFFGREGLSNYAAANAALDSLAHNRRQRGLTALSINWGTWANVGMAQIDEEEAWESFGLLPLDPARSVAALGRALTSEATQLAIFEMDWSLYASQQTTIPAIFAQLAHPQRAAVSSFKHELAQLPAGEQPRHLENHLQASVARVLGFARADDLRPTSGFFELGMDSLMAMELRNQLQTDLDAVLPPTLTFKYPNVATLTRFLAEDVLELSLDEPNEPHDEEAVTDLDEAELAALIDAELEQLLS